VLLQQPRCGAIHRNFGKNKSEWDICKDAISLPGIVLQYLLRGTEERKLHAPSAKAYRHLKAVVSGDLSIVFTRYHEAGISKIHSCQYSDAVKACKRILGYDANALYLSMMAKDMSCGKDKVNNYPAPVKAVQQVRSAVLSGKLFGFVKCKFAVPKWLWPKFKEMPPVFVNREIPEAAIPKEMLDYLKHIRQKRRSF